MLNIPYNYRTRYSYHDKQFGFFLAYCTFWRQKIWWLSLHLDDNSEVTQVIGKIKPISLLTSLPDFFLAYSFSLLWLLQLALLAETFYNSLKQQISSDASM